MKMRVPIITFVCLLLVIPCQGRIITVDDDGPADFNNIQAAIDDANDGDTIEVKTGTYTGNGNRDIDFGGRAITVRSIDPNDPDIVAGTTVDCNYEGRGFQFVNGEDSNSILEGLTITKGFHELRSCGIYARGYSGPTIRHCIVSDNIGCGIYCGQGFEKNLEVTGCIITNNSGCGISCFEGVFTVVRCIISRHSYCGIGGYSKYGGTSTITDCIITENVGGVRVSSSTPMETIIRNCIIAGNISEDYGGGLYLRHVEPIIINCTITGNSAVLDGGGIYCYGGSAIINNCNIFCNRANNGGGIYCNRRSTPNVTNCILWENIAQDGKEIYLTEHSDFYVSYSDMPSGLNDVYLDSGCSINWGQGNITADPCFVHPGYWDANGTPNDVNDDFWVDGDYHLKSEGWRWDTDANEWTWDEVTSRCIDAGNPGCPTDNEPLPHSDNRINMGAYGGTAEASMPPYDWAILGDLNNDGTVNFEDYSFQAADWDKTGDCQGGDLNRDGVIDMADVALMREDWLKQTSWHE